MDVGQSSLQQGIEDMTFDTVEGSGDTDDTEEVAGMTETMRGEESQSPPRSRQTTSSKKRKLEGRTTRAKKRKDDDVEASSMALEVFKAKKLLEEAESKPMPIFKELGERVKVVADVHGEGDKFISEAMELIKERNEEDFFLGFPTDGAAYDWLTKKLYEKRTSYYM